METFDIVVVGAGINGLGIARDAAARGLSVAVVEKDDLCSGVSAWSGRLVHGGLRYLERAEIGLVRESLRERERLFRLAPHLVKPIRLLMPFFAKNSRPSWMIRLGMIAYDVLSYDKLSPRHRILSAESVVRRFPGIERGGMTGSAEFTDGQVPYAERLCVELAVAAAADGAAILTHTRATGIVVHDGVATGVEVEDRTGLRSEMAARVIINAAGPWVDWVLGNPNDAPAAGATRHIGGAKGTHIIVDRFAGGPDDVIYYESQQDQRLVLVIPWMGRYLVGCTDTKFDPNPDEARATSDEVAYLLREVNTLVPTAQLTIDDVAFTYSGVRPLPHRPGVPEWKVPRSHVLHDHAADGRAHLFSAISGKLTTYRQLAEDAVDLAQKTLGLKVTPSPTRSQPFPGAPSGGVDDLRRRFARESGLDLAVSDRLSDLYGGRAELIAEIARKNPENAVRLSPDVPLIGAEVIFAVEAEFATTVTDVMARRTLLAFEPGHNLPVAEPVADLMTDLLGWNAAEREHQIAEYHEWLGHLAVPSVTAEA